MRWIGGWAVLALGCARGVQDTDASDTDSADSNGQDTAQQDSDEQDSGGSDTDTGSDTGIDTEDPPNPITVHVFTSLRIQYTDMASFWSEDQGIRDAARLQHEWLTFEIPGNQEAAILAASLDPDASVAYAEELAVMGMGSTTPWANTNFAFPTPNTDGRTSVIVKPNVLMYEGDAFNIDVELADDTTASSTVSLTHRLEAPPWPRRIGRGGDWSDWTGQIMPITPEETLTLEVDHPTDVFGNPETSVGYYVQVFPMVNGQNEMSQGQFLFFGDMEVVDGQVELEVPGSMFPATVNTNQGAAAVTGYQVDACIKGGDGANNNAGAFIVFAVE